MTRTKYAKHHRPVYLVANTVDPLKKADNEADDGGGNGDGEVDGGHFDLAVHAIVEAGKGAPCDQQTDACEVESQKQSVCLWVRAKYAWRGGGRGGRSC